MSIDSDHTSILSNIDIKAMLLGNAKEKIMLGGELSLGMKVSGDELKFTGQEISIQLDNDAIDLGGLYGSLSSKLNQVAFIMPKIELKQLSSFVLNFEPQIPSNKLQNAIKIIRPTGSLSETFLYLDLEKLGSDYRVVSVLDNANFGAYLGSPEMRNLSGIISLSPGRGYLDIDSENIGLHFKSDFPEVWPFDSIRGRMLYYDEEDTFRVSSRLLKFSYNDLSAVGKIKLNFPRAEEYSWELLLGVNAVSYTHLTLPTKRIV